MVEGLQQIDSNRVKKADKEVQEENKKKRIKRRIGKKSKNEEDDYCPAGRDSRQQWAEPQSPLFLWRPIKQCRWRRPLIFSTSYFQHYMDTSCN
ncbi:hypothetical protein J6590_075840 [Homalodisca vitripennis]|nr:hypothetical protein J6590_075840 [Homalodisca vitripennis]